MTHTLEAISKHLGVSLRTVQEWISAGELRAINVSRNRSSRKPRLRVLDSDLEAFLAGRAVGAEQPRTRRRRRATSTRQYV